MTIYQTTSGIIDTCGMVGCDDQAIWTHPQWRDQPKPQWTRLCSRHADQVACGGGRYVLNLGHSLLAQPVRPVPTTFCSKAEASRMLRLKPQVIDRYELIGRLTRQEDGTYPKDQVKALVADLAAKKAAIAAEAAAL